MKKVKSFYVTLGFLAGIVFVVACGSNSSVIAQAIGDAFDVIFDNSATSLKADNMQAAIEELSAKVDALENNLSTQIIGTWVCKNNRCSSPLSSITFYQDGTYDCPEVNIENNNVCHPKEYLEQQNMTQKYEINGTILKLTTTWEEVDESNVYKFVIGISNNEMWFENENAEYTKQL